MHFPVALEYVDPEKKRYPVCTTYLRISGC
jgi:hypothetical protein